MYNYSPEKQKEDVFFHTGQKPVFLRGIPAPGRGVDPACLRGIHPLFPPCGAGGRLRGTYGASLSPWFPGKKTSTACRCARRERWGGGLGRHGIGECGRLSPRGPLVASVEDGTPELHLCPISCVQVELIGELLPLIEGLPSSVVHLHLDNGGLAPRGKLPDGNGFPFAGPANPDLPLPSRCARGPQPCPIGRGAGLWAWEGGLFAVARSAGMEPDDSLTLGAILVELLREGVVSLGRLVPLSVPLLPVLPRLLKSLPLGRAQGRVVLSVELLHEVGKPRMKLGVVFG
jgi:hypothetical protein